MFRVGFVFFLTIILKTSVALALSQVCSALTQSSSLIPLSLPVVVLNTSRYQDPFANPTTIVNTVFAPGTALNSKLAQVVNLNNVWFPNSRWTKFVIGDGSVRRAFNSVDASPRSRLTSWINAILWDLGQRHPGFTDENLIQFLAFELTSRHMGWTQYSYLGDGRPEFPWDQQIPENKDLGLDFMTLIDKEVSLDWWTTREKNFPVVPLEKYLEFGKGYCLQRTLVTSLVLSARGLRHRIVNGALDFGPGATGGHTWIELADGRMLDSSMNLLEVPQRNHQHQKNWYFMGTGYRFESQLYPALLF